MAIEALSYCLEQVDTHREIANSFSNGQIIEQRTVKDHAEEYGSRIFFNNEHEPLNQYELLFRKSGTYHLGSFEKSTGIESFADLPGEDALTVSDMVEKIKDVFGLNRVQVAHVVKVSRPTLYNHLTEKEKPKSLDSYTEMYELALEVERKVAFDIRPGLKSVLVDGKTLLAHLKARPIDTNKILEVSKLISEKLAKHNGRKSASNNDSLRRTTNAITRAG